MYIAAPTEPKQIIASHVSYGGSYVTNDKSGALTGAYFCQTIDHRNYLASCTPHEIRPNRHLLPLQACAPAHKHTHTHTTVNKFAIWMICGQFCLPVYIYDILGVPYTEMSFCFATVCFSSFLILSLLGSLTYTHAYYHE